MTDEHAETDTWPAPWILPTRHLPATVSDEQPENGREDTPTDSDAAESVYARRDRCGFTVLDSDGNEEPCDRPATGWRWYQDVEHEDMLDAACEDHENEGGRRIHVADAEMSALSVVHEREVAELRAEVATVREAGAVLCEQIRSDWERLARMMRIARKRGDDVENLRVSREGMRLQRDYTRLQRDEQKADADSLGDALVEEVARAEAAESREAALREAVAGLADEWESLGPTDVAWHWDKLGDSLRAALASVPRPVAEVGAADTQDEGAAQVDPACLTHAHIPWNNWCTPMAGSKVDAAPETVRDCPHLPDCFNYPDVPIGRTGDAATHDTDWRCCTLTVEHWHLLDGVGIRYDAAPESGEGR